jgi:hypothetical protein
VCAADVVVCNCAQSLAVLVCSSEFCVHTADVVVCDCAHILAVLCAAVSCVVLCFSVGHQAHSTVGAVYCSHNSSVCCTVVLQRVSAEM